MGAGHTSRKRVEAALNHQEPDRVPMSMTITEIPYLRLREHIGLPPDDGLRPNRFGEVEPAVDLLEALGFDTATIKLRPPEINIAPGALPDGTVFDDSYSRNEPAVFGVNQVIPGWSEVLQLMKEGSTYRVVIPPALAYGERGVPPTIEPNAVLIFDVELISIAQAAEENKE